MLKMDDVIKNEDDGGRRR